MRFALAATIAVAVISQIQADDVKIELNQLPKSVVESVKKRFPKAEMMSAMKETEGKKTSYEITLKDGMGQVDVDVNEDGVITGFEKAIDIKMLPKAVKETIAKEHPKATVKKAEEVTKISDGKEKIEYYEVTVEVDAKDIEVEVLPDGKLKPTKK